MNRFYPFVAQRARARCEYCRAPEEITNGVFEVEHIVPMAKNGASEYDNFALASPACNGYKSDFITDIDPVTDTEVRLYIHAVIFGATTSAQTMLARSKGLPMSGGQRWLGCN